MALPNPKALIRSIAEKKKKEQEAIALLKERLKFSLHSKKIEARNERRKLTEALTLHGIKAEEYMRLASEAGNNIRTFVRWEKKIAVHNKVNTLADVQVTPTSSTFTKVVAVVRSLYAEDIASDIPFDDVVVVIIDDLLLHT